MYHHNHDTIVISILQVKVMRHREIRSLAQGVTAGKGCCWDLNLGSRFQSCCSKALSLDGKVTKLSGVTGTENWDRRSWL